MTEQATLGDSTPSTARIEPTIWPKGYRLYVMVVLIALYTSNFIDRTILGTLGQPIKEDLKLTDGQLGLLGGLSFALLYSTLGIPVARLAERYKRVTVIASALAVWSGMTAVCGLAGNFAQLMAARIGVGIGEAGCIPPANSLISDYYPPERRASAAGAFSLGIPLGAVLGALIGGAVAQRWGWRAAFMMVGLPGLALALLVKLTVREPVRGGYDRMVQDVAPSIRAAAKSLLGKPTFRHSAFAAALTSFAGYGVSTFGVPFLLRGFHLSLMQASVAFALFGGVGAGIGVFSGGFIADRAGRKDRRMHMWIPAACLILCGPLYMAAFLQKDLATLGVLVVAPAILQYIYLGPVFAATANMAGPRSRATASAILTLIINLIGLGLGPTLIGLASDQFAAHAYTGLMPYAQACPGGLPPAGASGFAAESCHRASFIGLQRALVVSAAVYVWAGVHLILAARTIRQDLES